MCKTTGIRDRLISHTLSGAPSENSLFWDTLQARRLKNRTTHASIGTDARFLMSSKACTYANEFRGFWLHIPHISDLTINLRVYVPRLEYACGRGATAVPRDTPSLEVRTAQMWDLIVLFGHTLHVSWW